MKLEDNFVVKSFDRMSEKVCDLYGRKILHLNDDDLNFNLSLNSSEEEWYNHFAGLYYALLGLSMTVPSVYSLVGTAKEFVDVINHFSNTSDMLKDLGQEILYATSAGFFGGISKKCGDYYKGLRHKRELAIEK